MLRRSTSWRAGEGRFTASWKGKKGREDDKHFNPSRMLRSAVVELRESSGERDFASGGAVGPLKLISLLSHPKKCRRR